MLSRKRIILVFILAGFSLVTYMYLESRWLKIHNIEISSSDLPVEFNESKIIFASDIHHGPYLSKRRVKKLVKQINILKPDIILLGGDYVHRNPKYIESFFERAKILKADHGIYAVLGNHDHWEDAELTEKLMRKYNFNICRNNSYWVKMRNDSIKIGGVGDLWEDDQIIENTISDVNSSDFCILISHNPDYFENLNTELIDLAVAGHTHGGQVTYFGKKAPILPIKNGEKYRLGLKKQENSILYITSGVGTITPPLRFFCRPEIVVLKLLKI